MASVWPPRGDDSGCPGQRGGPGGGLRAVTASRRPRGADAGRPGRTASPSSMSPAQVTAAEDAFSLALFDRVCPSKPGPNLLLSPESAAQALGMLYAGAKGPTAASLGRLLRLPAWNPGLVAALDRHTATLAGLHQLAVSNHLFAQSGNRAHPAGARRPAHRLPHRPGGGRLRGRARDHEPDQRGRRPRDPRPDSCPLPGTAAPVHPGRADQRPLPEGALAATRSRRPARRRSTPATAGWSGCR